MEDANALLIDGILWISKYIKSDLLSVWHFTRENNVKIKIFSYNDKQYDYI